MKADQKRTSPCCIFCNALEKIYFFILHVNATFYHIQWKRIVEDWPTNQHCSCILCYSTLPRTLWLAEYIFVTVSKSKCRGHVHYCVSFLYTTIAKCLTTFTFFCNKVFVCVMLLHNTLPKTYKKLNPNLMSNKYKVTNFQILKLDG